MRRVIAFSATVLLVATLVWAVPTTSEKTYHVGQPARGDILEVDGWRMEVIGPEAVPSADGTRASTARIDWSSTQELTWWVDAQGTIVATGSQGATRGPDPSQPPENPLPAALLDYQRRELDIGAALPACLFMPLSAWQVDGQCLLAPGLNITYDGRPAEAAGDGLRIGAAYWDDGAAFPHTIQADAAWPIQVVTRGDGAPFAAAEGRAAPLAWARPAPWGLAEGGASTAFQPSEAYDAALSDATDEYAATFQQWVSDNPGHVAVSVDAFRVFSMAGESRRLDIMFSSETSSFGLGVVKQVPGTTVLSLPSESEAAAMYSFSTWRSDDLIPPPSALPAQWPTMASLTERWHDVAGPWFTEADASSIPFRWDCSRRCTLDDLKIRVHHWDGEHSVVSAAQGSGGQQDWGYSTLHLDGTGTLHHLKEWTSQRQTLDEAPTQAARPSAVATQASQSAGTPVVVGVAAVGLVATALLARLPFTRLFSRIGEDALLDHPVRRRLHDAITQRPGIRFRELCRQTKTSNGSAQHHLTRLLQAGRLRAERRPGGTSYFPNDTPPAMVEGLRLAQDSSRRTIMETLSVAPTPASKLVPMVGLSRSTVYGHVQRLTAGGLVERGSDGLCLTPTGRQVLRNL